MRHQSNILCVVLVDMLSVCRMHRREQKTAKFGMRALCFSVDREQDKEDLQNANH